MIFKWTATFVVVAIVVVAYFVYRHKTKAYAEGKVERIKAIPGMSILYRPIKLATLIISLWSLHDPNKWLLIFSRPIWIGWIGLVTAVCGIALLVWSKISIGKAYSPCFESFVPPELVKRGPYRWIRHPMYSANFLVLVGFTLVSGSAWIMLCFLIVFVYFAASAREEERTLRDKLVGYQSYEERTGAFMPKIFG